MIRHVEKENLRSADQQHGLDARRIVRKSALEEFLEEMPQRADTAQHGRDQLADQRAVTICERGEAGMRLGALKLRVERTPPAQHIVEDISGDAACGQSRNLGGRYASG